MKVFFFVLFALLFVVAYSHRSHPTHIVKNKQEAHCFSEEAWKYKLLKNKHRTNLTHATCPIHGKCDNPEVRNQASLEPLMMRLAVNVIGENVTTQRHINDQLTTLKKFMNPYGIDFHTVHVGWHSTHKCVSPYTGEIGSWWEEIEGYKRRYTFKPEQTMNIFVTCQQKTSFSFLLLGFAIMPWDSDATRDVGGLWINSEYWGDGGMTLPHEFGHAIGLLHPFVGSECGKNCYEPIHNFDDTSADYTGDFCADTPATPTNYECGPPREVDCRGRSYGQTDYHNIMGYAPDPCLTHFTPCQQARMHCWICSHLKGFLVNPQACGN